ncbi:hypothetical protein AKJ16_DCAP16907 [Drosera capensis]
MGNCMCAQLRSANSSSSSPPPPPHHPSASELHQMIKVVTSTGGVMELYAPITADSITDEFPGHRLFPSPDFVSPPINNKEQLRPGRLYYLLPVPVRTVTPTSTASKVAATDASDHSKNFSPRSMPYRMSFDSQRILKRVDQRRDVGPRYGGAGVWKVRLVINPEQLSDILSEEATTQEFVESVRTVARWGGGGAPSSVSSECSSVAGSWRPGGSDKYHDL